MKPRDVSRRGFIVGGTGLASVPLAASQQAGGQITAGEVIERIKQHVGVEWRSQTVDNVITGDKATPVKGIAVAMMSTFDVLKAAAANGKNMVITHEPTFYTHLDGTEEIAEDATYRHKRDLIREHDMVIFRLHDHWHALRPTDGIAVGMARELGWDSNADTPRRFALETTTLRDLVRHIKSRLGANTMRVAGDPDMPVSNVVANWGYTAGPKGIQLLAQPDVDVLVVGETREWELVEFAQDIISSGKKKALIVIGHIASEQAGMKFCAEWLKGFVDEVPIEYIVTPEPFWSPGCQS